MNEGWVSVHRKLLDWEWWDDHNTTRLFLYLILQANHQAKKWKGKLIERGSLITSVEKLACGVGLSIQQVRTSLNKLISTSEVTKSTTSTYTVISIKNYGRYQGNNKQNNKRATNEQQTNNKRITTNNNENNENNENNIGTTEPETKIAKKRDFVVSFLSFKKQKEEILQEATKKYPDKNCEKAIDTFIAKNEAKNYKYKNYKLAFFNWVREDRYGEYAANGFAKGHNGRPKLIIT